MIKKVVAYCRVSTDKDDQINSLENQKKFFSEYITRNMEWELVHIYADEGITGTSTSKRAAFNKMIQDAEKGSFDMILTKEISRFARNTLDSIFYTRMLKDCGIGVFFMNDNIYTLDPDSELRLTIMSSIAQEESRKISQRVKWGQKRSMEAGVAFGKLILGYNLNGGTLTINESEAEIVRLIFKKYLEENKGVNTISKELENEGYLTKTGSPKWHGSSLYKILQNEKYCGDLLQKKTYTPNYLNHKSIINKGDEEFVLIKNNHEPIISRETFEKTQNEMRRRAINKNMKNHRQSNRYPFSGKIECGLCGYKYVGRRRKRKNGLEYKTWQCGNHAKYGTLKLNEQGIEIGCSNKMLAETTLQRLFLGTLKKKLTNKENIKEEIMHAVYKALKDTNMHSASDISFKKLHAEIEKIKKKKRLAMDLYFESGISKSDLQDMNMMYDMQLKNMTDKVAKLSVHENISERRAKNLEEISCFIDDLLDCSVFNDEVCRCVLKKMIIHTRDDIEIHI